MTDAIVYRQATAADMPAVGEVFLAAFPESVQHYVGHPVPPRVMADVFSICLDTEPDAFFVAELNGRVMGYVFAPSRFSRLTPTAFRRGHVLRMFIHWVTRQYGFGWDPIRRSVKNWLALLHESHAPAQPAAEARILSIAVHPAAQGHGLGNGLMQYGLAYLDRQEAPVVRLEVRPTNGPAKHLYEKYGFVADGETQDAQGAWLVMYRRHP